MLSISVILVISQLISGVWVWHESQEQVGILVDVTLHENEKSDMVQHEINETIFAFLLPSLITIGITLLITLLLIRQLIQPFNRLTQSLQTRSSFNLTPLGLDNNNSTREIVTIMETLNQLFVRINDGIENERHFTSDIAHELRTPLAGFRLNLELLQENNPELVNRLIQRIDEMINSIEQLLHLSRTSQKILKGDAVKMDFVAEVIEPMKMEIEELGFPHPIIWDTPSQAFIYGDSGLLFLMLGNLRENIRKHAGDSN